MAPGDARVRVRLIDFAHAFPSVADDVAVVDGGGTGCGAGGQGRQVERSERQQQKAQQQAAGEAQVEEGGLLSSGPCGIDQNFLDGLKSLIAVLTEAVAAAETAEV